MRAERPGLIEFAELELYDLGVPQRRKRLLAGPPWLIRKVLRSRSNERRVSIAQSIKVLQGTHIRTTLSHAKVRKRTRHDPPGDTKNIYVAASWEQGWHHVSGPAPTIISFKNSGWWVKMVNGEVVRCPLRKSDAAALQTFPCDYIFPKSKRPAFALIGNAVPPVLARVIFE